MKNFALLLGWVSRERFRVICAVIGIIYALFLGAKLAKPQSPPSRITVDTIGLIRINPESTNVATDSAKPQLMVAVVTDTGSQKKVEDDPTEQAAIALLVTALILLAISHFRPRQSPYQ